MKLFINIYLTRLAIVENKRKIDNLNKKVGILSNKICVGYSFLFL